MTYRARYTNAHDAETAVMMSEVTKIRSPSAEDGADSRRHVVGPGVLQPPIDMAARYERLRAFAKENVLQPRPDQMNCGVRGVSIILYFKARSQTG